MIELPCTPRILNALLAIGLGLFGVYMLVSLGLFVTSPWMRVSFVLGVVILIGNRFLNLTRYYRVRLLSDRMEIRMPYAPSKTRYYSDVQKLSLQREAGGYDPPLIVHFRDGHPLFVPSSDSLEVMELIQQRSPVAIEGYERSA